jgi:hypothetical protein
MPAWCLKRSPSGADGGRRDGFSPKGLNPMAEGADISSVSTCDQVTVPRRAAGLVARDVGTEVVLHDPRTHRVHLLDPLSAAVWRNCDGAGHDVEDLLAALRRIDPAADARTLDAILSRLAELDVLETGYSRRAVLGRFAAVATGAVVLPAVTSIVGPVAAAHASTQHTIVLISTAQRADRRDPAVEACDTATGNYQAAYAFSDSTYSSVAGTGWVSFNKGGQGLTQHYYYRIAFTLPSGYSNASISITGYVDDSTVVWLGAPTVALGGTQIGSMSGWTGTASTVVYGSKQGFVQGTQYLYFVENNSGGGLEGIDFAATVSYSA